MLDACFLHLHAAAWIACESWPTCLNGEMFVDFKCEFVR